ncbi:MAG: flagellar assembly protein FliW [Pelosinus sp.]|nr:flagellar assembly protein FliW [Pelosinus sp.]
MLIQSTRLGEIEIDESELIHFPYGVPGFLDEKEFALLAVQEGNPFSFLQSTREPNLTFIIVDPFSFFSDYEFEIKDEIAEEFGFNEADVLQIMSMVRVPENPEEMTANLLAPVIINLVNRRAIQFVLEKSPYQIRHRLFPQGFAKEPGKGGK